MKTRTIRNGSDRWSRRPSRVAFVLFRAEWSINITIGRPRHSSSDPQRQRQASPCPCPACLLTYSYLQLLTATYSYLLARWLVGVVIIRCLHLWRFNTISSAITRLSLTPLTLTRPWCSLHPHLHLHLHQHHHHHLHHQFPRKTKTTL